MIGIYDELSAKIGQSRARALFDCLDSYYNRSMEAAPCKPS
jgi:hypothetical protein